MDDDQSMVWESVDGIFELPDVEDVGLKKSLFKKIDKVSVWECGFQPAALPGPAGAKKEEGSARRGYNSLIFFVYINLHR